MAKEKKDATVEKEEVKEEKSDKKPKEIDMKDLTILPGIGPETAKKLMATRYNNIKSIAVATPGQINDIVEIGPAVARKAIDAAKEMLNIGMISGLELLERNKSKQMIPIGASEFDKILGGGIATGDVTEAYGEFASGKSQIAHLLCVNTMKTFPDSEVVFIDTEFTFHPERVINFAKGAGLDSDLVLKKINLARSYNTDDQMLYAEKVEDLIKKGKNIKLLVIDSVTAHFRAEFTGRGELFTRQSILNQHLNTLKRIADMYNIAVYITNQVMSKPDMFFGDPTVAIGGHIMGHAAGVRMYLRKGKKGSRVAKIIDAPHLAEAECSFMIEGDKISNA